MFNAKSVTTRVFVFTGLAFILAAFPPMLAADPRVERWVQSQTEQFLSETLGVMARVTKGPDGAFSQAPKDDRISADSSTRHEQREVAPWCDEQCARNWVLETLND